MAYRLRGYTAVPKIQVLARHPLLYAVVSPSNRVRAKRLRGDALEGATREREHTALPGSMSRLLTDEQVTLLSKGFVAVLFAISLLSLIAEFRADGTLVTLSGALVFVYVSSVLVIGVFTDRLFAPVTQIALFVGFTAYWTYDYFARDTTLSILLIVFGLTVLPQQGRRLLG